VTKIVTKEGAENWSRISSRWEGWHQERPVLKARVITVDGQVHELDPATISESSANPGVPRVFSDVREVRAPLPAVAPGCIAEEESVIRDTEPFYDHGVVTTVGFLFGKAYPAKRVRLILEAPGSLPIRYAVVGLGDMRPKREETRGQLRLTFESGPIASEIDFEPHTSRDVRQVPQIIFSTGQSWADLAQHYSGIVDRQIQNADLRLMLAGSPETGTPRERWSSARSSSSTRMSAV